MLGALRSAAATLASVVLGSFWRVHAAVSSLGALFVRVLVFPYRVTGLFCSSFYSSATRAIQRARSMVAFSKSVQLFQIPAHSKKQPPGPRALQVKQVKSMPQQDNHDDAHSDAFTHSAGSESQARTPVATPGLSPERRRGGDDDGSPLPKLKYENLSPMQREVLKRTNQVTAPSFRSFLFHPPFMPTCPINLRRRLKRGCGCNKKYRYEFPSSAPGGAAPLPCECVKNDEKMNAEEGKKCI